MRQIILSAARHLAFLIDPSVAGPVRGKSPTNGVEMSEDSPLYGGRAIVVTTDDGTQFNCAPYGGIRTPPLADVDR